MAAERSEEGARLLREFGRRVYTWRERRGKTQMELALESGLHPTYIGQVENGQRNLAIINVCKLAAALDVQPADLMPPLT